MRHSFLVFTDEGVELSEAAALLLALRHSAAKRIPLADEPHLSVDRVTIFCGEGYEEDVPEDLADLDSWSVEYTVAR
jgi:hypothetical protein